MDKKLFKQSSNFFKKEGFYVILFVCLCIVATVAAITSRNNKLAKTPVPIQNADSSNLAEGPEYPPDNSDLVKKGSPIKVVKSGNDAVAVSKTVDMSSAKKPIDGEVVIKYSTANDTILVNSNSNLKSYSYKNFSGVFIKCKTPDKDFVTAVLDGTVESVSKEEFDDGAKVVIRHDNGYKTVYANLDPAQIKVSKNQKVKQGDKLGMVGKSSGYMTLQEKYGKYLYFQVLNGNSPVDPAKFTAFRYQ